MDIEKLIVSLRSPSWQDLEDPDATLLDDAATALSTLQAENEKLQAEVERQRRSADDSQHLYENAERAYIKVLAELEQAKREQIRIPEGYALVKLELLEELDNFRDLGPIDRLRELAQADKLIGKTVYYPYAEKILEKRMSHFIIYDERRANLPPKESWFCINDDKSETFGFEDIGKTVFLTREEAESALRREKE